MALTSSPDDVRAGPMSPYLRETVQHEKQPTALRGVGGLVPDSRHRREGPVERSQVTGRVGMISKT